MSCSTNTTPLTTLGDFSSAFNKFCDASKHLTETVETLWQSLTPEEGKRVEDAHQSGDNTQKREVLELLRPKLQSMKGDIPTLQGSLKSFAEAYMVCKVWERALLEDDSVDDKSKTTASDSMEIAKGTDVELSERASLLIQGYLWLMEFQKEFGEPTNSETGGSGGETTA